MKFLKYFIFLLPINVFAQTPIPRTDSTFSDVVNGILDLVNLLIPVVASLALLAFFWGLAKFIYNAGDVKTHEEGKQLMIWGIIALFVMVSVWGILNFFSGEFGFGRIGIPSLPTGAN